MRKTKKQPFEQYEKEISKQLEKERRRISPFILGLVSMLGTTKLRADGNPYIIDEHEIWSVRNTKPGLVAKTFRGIFERTDVDKPAFSFALRIPASRLEDPDVQALTEAIHENMNLQEGYRVIREFEDKRTDKMKDRLELVRADNPGKKIMPLSWGDRETRFIEIEFV